MSDNEKDFDDEEDEEDFDDDDFEDDVEEETPKKKKRKKEVSAASYFLDNEADVDEEAEEEDEEYEKDTGEIDWDAAQAEANAAQQNRQFHRRHLYDQDKSVEELAREIEERHKNYVLEDEDLEDDEDAPTELKRTGMLPSVRDPKLWMVHCKIGKERPTVIALMRKFFDPESKLAIKSAIAPGHLKGFIYIEAEKESHVKHAIKGMRTLSEWTLKLVPIKEMPDVLTVTKKANAFHKGDWVRVKRGLYKLDIGQVYDVDESRGRVTVKLIPRLDLQNMSKPEEGKKVKRLRMPARFFNPDEVNQVLGSRSDMDRRVDPYTGEHFYVLMGNRFLNGYLLKPMDVRSLEGGEVQPTLEELKKFQEKPPETGEESTTTSTEDLASLASTLKQQRRVAFKKGDTIIVVEGDLKHLMGTVESVDRETVTIRPKHEELHDLLTFPADQLRKYFKKGDHVKVITGRFDGETGLIIRVEENSVIIFSDLTNQEIKVFTQDIQECSEVSTGKIKLGNYELHDLVVYGATVGIITKIERDQFKLLDTTGTLQTVALSAMGPKKNSPRNANTFDSSQNVINVGDIVKVVDGQHKGRQGTIKHIFRYFLFLHSREMLENSGIFVVRTSHVTALGSKARPGDLVGALPGTQHFPPSSPGPRNLRSPARNAPSLPNTFDRKRSFKDTLKDKHVVILRGQWKGYVGIVRDSTETNARVELHTNSKIVTVPRDSVRLKDEAASEGSTMQEPSLYPPQTPAWGSRTPMREDPTATPLRTPSRTPSTPLRGVPGTPVHGTAWDASIPNTPMRTGSSWEPDYSANWTPSTPGAYSSQFTPYSPARQYDNTPADNPTTPSALTPGTYDQRTPMDSTPYSSSYQPNTPGTPGPVTPRGPNTPASEYGEQATPSSPGRYQWYIPKAEVTVNGELGVIQDVVIEKGMFVCKVLMDNTKQTVSVLADQAVKVVPGKGAPVIIVMGEQKGQTGTLIGIDNEDGIVKMDSNLDIKILDREHLAKYRK